MRPYYCSTFVRFLCICGRYAADDYDRMHSVLDREEASVMKICESWKRNVPDTAGGESITVTIIYSSFDKAEIDELEKSLPAGMLVMNTDKKDKV